MTLQSFHRKALAAGLLFSTLPGLSSAETALNPKASVEQVEQIVHDYILAHPEVVLESVRSFDQRAKAEQVQKAQEKVKASLAELHANSPAVGAIRQGR